MTGFHHLSGGKLIDEDIFSFIFSALCLSSGAKAPPMFPELAVGLDVVRRHIQLLNVLCC